MNTKFDLLQNEEELEKSTLEQGSDSKKKELVELQMEVKAT